MPATRPRFGGIFGPRAARRSAALTCMLALFLAVVVGGASGCGSGTTEPTGGAAPDGSEEAAAAGGAAAPRPAVEPRTAREVLEAMAAAYRGAGSYADSGSVRLVAVTDAEEIDQSADFSVTFERPSKLRLNVYQAMAACDGSSFHAAVQGAPDQVLVRPAPEKMTFSFIYSDPVLARALSTGLQGEGFAGAPPQLILLFQPDAVGLLLQGAGEPALAEPGEIDGRECYRVQVRRADGTGHFWIDRETFALRRVVFPVDGLRQALGRQATVQSVSMVADFTGARLGGPIDPTAFRFEAPKESETVRFLVEANPAQLLGKPLAGLNLTDLDGKPVTVESLRGRITVLAVVASAWPQLIEALSDLNGVYRQFRNDPNVAFYVVSVDRPETSNADLLAALERHGIEMPALRDLEGSSARALNLAGIPALALLDAKGVFQDFDDTNLAEKIRKLLAGEDVFPAGVADYQRRLQEYERGIQEAVAAQEKVEAGGAPLAEQPDVPMAEIAPPSRPQTLRLRKLWKCSELNSPGNLIFLDGERPRVVVIDSWRSMAEVGADGKVIARQPLDLGEEDFFVSLRTTTAADGKRYYCVFASSKQQLYVLDDSFRLLLRYPGDAADGSHTGIADVQFGDLDGDGVPELYVSYWGVVGVQAVTLEGKRTDANRTVMNAVRMAATGPDALGRRALVAANGVEPLTVLDGKLQRQGEVAIPGKMLFWIVRAELLGEGLASWCGLAAPEVGRTVAVGFDLTGRELWNYELPPGVPSQPIEMILSGRVTPKPPGQWILPGPDGSVHVVTHDGKLLDRFNYGAALHGLATGEINGKPVLFIASAAGIEALEIE